MSPFPREQSQMTPEELLGQPVLRVSLAMGALSGGEEPVIHEHGYTAEAERGPAARRQFTRCHAVSVLRVTARAKPTRKAR